MAYEDDTDDMDSVDFIEHWGPDVRYAPEEEFDGIIFELVEDEMFPHIVFEESILDVLDIPYKELRNFPKNFNVYEVLLARLYGSKDVKTGIHARFAEKAAASYLHHLQFSSIEDLNVNAILANPYEWKDDVYATPMDIRATYKGETYFFDVKSQQNTEYKGFWHDLSKLREQENILFLRTNGDVHDIKITPVGYILYPVLRDLIRINPKYQKKIPSFFFFNNDLGSFYEYSRTNDPLEVPFLLEAIMTDMKAGKKVQISKEQATKISAYVNASQNRDAFNLMRHFKSSFILKTVKKTAA